MVFSFTEKTQLFGCLEGDKIAHQLTQYAYAKRVKELFLIIKLTNSFSFISNTVQNLFKQKC